MSNLRPIARAVTLAVQSDEPWQHFLSGSDYRSAALNSVSERRDFDAAVERLWELCRQMVREHERG